MTTPGSHIRAGGRAGHRPAGALGFAQALIKYGIPDEALTDNAKGSSPAGSGGAVRCCS